MRSLYIFDLDGTLSNAEHRKHLIEGDNRKDPANWDAFYAASKNDPPVPAVIKLFNLLLEAGSDCWIFTGRSDIVGEETENWIRQHTVASDYKDAVQIIMRSAEDRTLDHDLKKRWLENMLPSDRDRIVCVFEDRARVVQMWREQGLSCLQVAPGDF